ncbi:MAG: nucleotidyltransferase domain-containing protein [Betaproteobacteria bacterium]
MARFVELSLTAQTAYSQLFDVTQAWELARSVATLHGSFASKTVKGRRYWYFQFTDLSRTLRQLYVGPDSDRVRELISEARQTRPEPIPALARSAVALGCAALLSRHYRVIRRLSEYGFFRTGGVLIGTHAFLAYANLFGVRWGDASRTQDVDFAHAGKNLAVALPSSVQVDTRGAIESLEMGLLPITRLVAKSEATYLNPKDPEFRLDFLTTLHRNKEQQYHHRQLGITLQPSKFMEYLLENVGQAAVFSDEGSVVVNIPHPARYALHKLLVYGERTGSFLQKSRKDLFQAAALLEVMRLRRAWEIDEAWSDLIGRGKGWSTRAKQGLDALAELAPDLDAKTWLRFPKARRRIARP